MTLHQGQGHRNEHGHNYEYESYVYVYVYRHVKSESRSLNIVRDITIRLQVHNVSRLRRGCDVESRGPRTGEYYINL